MKRLLFSMVSICALTGAFADHAQLESLTNEVAVDTRQLRIAARNVIGYYPTYRQRYAYEHIMFLENAAKRFQSAVQSGADDHSQITSAYHRLERDAYYARYTFEDLFRYYRDDVTDDHSHPNFAPMDNLLRKIEKHIGEISPNLP